MECYRCGAALKDTAVVCNRCGFIMKGAKKIEPKEPMTFEEKVNNATPEELRNWVLQYRRAQEKAVEYKDKVDPKKSVMSSKRWAVLTFVFGLLACLFVIVPGFNVMIALALFVMAFVGFGKSAGHNGTLALIGIVLSVVGICGAWVFNVYAAETVGQMLGLTGGTTTVQ